MPKPNTTPSGSDPRRVAAKVIAKVLAQEAFSNLALSHAMNESSLSPRDKALCTELVYGTIRWAKPLELSIRRALDKPNQKIDDEILPHLLVAAYQLQHLEEKIPAHAAVNAAVNAVKKRRPYLAGFTNLILRRLGSPLHTSLTQQDNLPALSDAFGLPLFVVQAIASLLPQSEWYDACAAMTARPKTWIRAFGPLEIKDDGVPHAFVPDAFGFDKIGMVNQLEGFDDGRFMVQDPASQIAGLLVDGKPGDFVLDCCAAPGSKSMILKHAVGIKGRVLAIDQNERKTKNILQNATRLKLNVETKAMDARALGQDHSLKQKVDAVLLDAPCTGLGTLRRHPEIKLKRSEQDVADAAQLQAELLASAAACVKPGGVLVYSVCSPMPQEGSELVARFLQDHLEFERENASTCLPWLPQNALNEQSEVVLWPHRHDCDAFFAVRLKKR